VTTTFVIFSGLLLLLPGLQDKASPKIVTAPARKTGTIICINPPDEGFFSKKLDYKGIPIRAHQDVSDQALYECKSRLSMMLQRLPVVTENLKRAGAELQIIGKDQVTSDLPDYKDMKGKPFDGKLTVDERTRGFGGLHTSCGEENLLRLEKDRYKGRDICVHEFSHCIFSVGVDRPFRKQVVDQFKRSINKGLWVGAYSASNVDEFFAELAMWYWGTHGDLNMKGAKPNNGRDGFKAYDPEAYKLLDDFFSGRIEIEKRASVPKIGGK